MECVTYEFENNFNMDKNTSVSVIYRPPNNDTNVFIDTTNAVIEKTETDHKKIYLMGDYNIYFELWHT